MSFVEHLRNVHGYNEPIYVQELQYENYSRPWIFKELQRLVANSDIKRFSAGVYYFPQKTPFGDSCLDPQKIVERRFLSDGKDVYGYIAGVSLLNLAGLSTQVPNVLELVTNNETTRVRDLNIGTQRIRARRSRTPITAENVYVLQFLELMNAITPETLDETERYMLSKYTKTSGVTRNAVSLYANLFPARAMKNMVTSGIVYELA